MKGLFARAFHPRNEAVIPEQVLAHFRALGGGSTSSGVSVSPESALSVGAVFACVRVLSEDVAKLPLGLYRRRSGGGSDKVTDHRLYSLLHDAPNEVQTAFEFREMMQAHLALRGNAYAFVNRVKVGRSERVHELIPIHPDRVEPVRGADGVTVRYRVRTGAREVTEYGPDRVLHLRGLSSDGLVGLSPVALAKEAIGLAAAAERHGGAFFKNGAKPGLVVTHKEELSEVGHKNLRESIEAAVTGSNLFRVLLLEEDMKATAVGLNHADAQYIESRKFQVPEIARWYRMPLHKIQDLERSTNNNIEHQGLEYLTDTLQPWLVRWEQRMNLSLLTPEERAGGLFFKFNAKGYLRGSVQAQTQHYKDMWGIGVYSINDIRELEDLNPVEGGDIRLVPLNMVTLDRAGEPAEEEADDAQAA